MSSEYPELGFYALPGHVEDPHRIYEELRLGEQLGFGSVWISERPSTKDLGVLSGVAVASTRRMGIAAGLIANLPLRNPLIVAGYSSTMMKLSCNRFALGIGRGQDGIAHRTGTARLNFRILEDYVGILRRLWRGEVVTYEGPAGRLQGLALGAELDTLPPILMAVMGPKTCYWAGSFCDGVILNSLWSSSAVERSVALVRQGAEDAGRDPSSVKIWTILVTACDVPEDAFLRTVIHRMNTYVLAPTMFDAICTANGWDKSVAPRIREAIARTDGTRHTGPTGDEHVSRDTEYLRNLYSLYPREWILQGCAAGTATECVRALADRFDAGADGVLLHGSSPTALAPLLRVWSDRRPVTRFAGLPTNPGLRIRSPGEQSRV